MKKAPAGLAEVLQSTPIAASTSATGRGSPPEAAAPLLNIQALRAIAALLVVFVHLDRFLGKLGLIPIGQGGVDLFFVISGFIMTYATGTRPVTPLEFMRQRILRIVPIYWLITLIVFALVILRPSLLQATSADPVQLLKSLLFIPFAKSNGQVQPTLFVGWTLNYEMFFYLVFAIGLLIDDVTVRTTYVCGLLAALALAHGFLPPASIALEFYSQPIILEFCGGMLVAAALRSDRLQNIPLSTSLIMLSVSLIGIVILPVEFPQPSRVLTDGLPAVFAVFSAAALNSAGVIVRNRLPLLLGDASYSIYLTHAFVTQALQALGAKLGVGKGISAILIPITLALVCLAGVATYVWVERPLTRTMRRRRPIS